MGHGPRSRTIEAHARVVRAAFVAPDLGELVARYQDLLRLRDWRIDVSYKPDLATRDGRPVWGLCYPTVDARVATIEIRDPSTPPAGVSVEDAAAQVLETVVHELVHLHFAPFGNTSPAEIAAEEQAVWSLAEALIRSAGTTEEPTIARAMVAAIDTVRATHIERPRATKATGDSPMLSQKLIQMLIEVAASGDKKASPIAAAVISELLGAEAKEDPATEGEAAAPADAPPAAPARVVVPEVVSPEAALGRAVMSFVGVTNPSDALAEVARRISDAATVETATAEAARERAAVESIEAVERQALVASLVKLESETPATAWTDSTASVPCARLVAEPLPELRARVATLTASKRPVARIVPPTDGAVEGEISARELAMIDEMKIDPAKYLADKAKKKAVL